MNTPAHYKPTVEVDVNDLESLVQSSAVVRDILTAVSVHKNDVMVQRVAGGVANAIANCQRKIDDSRRMADDPLENEPPSGFEVKQLEAIHKKYLSGNYADVGFITPREGESIRRKKLAVLGTREIIFHWGNKIKEVQTSETLYWRLTDKGVSCIGGSKNLPNGVQRA